jgi:hypothetical protein
MDDLEQRLQSARTKEEYRQLAHDAMLALRNAQRNSKRWLELVESLGASLLENSYLRDE